MWDFNGGNKPVNSTYAPVSAPSTSTLIAELDSTQLGTVNYNTNFEQNWRVVWVLGCDTNATWQCETATSTALTAVIDTVYLKTPSFQSGEYVTVHRLGKDYRIRARLFSTAVNAVAYISAVPLT